ncbi:hypothetical protein QTP86_012702 [Hemibagrus guttatus]|nr:hypothetical protein QTP86_012702 [Hemibagrus guttatus]
MISNSNYNEILNQILSAPEASHCRVRVSCYHISNEKIYDLLEPQVSEVCRIHDTEEVVLLEGLRELEVGSAQELMDVYHSGITHRNTGGRTSLYRESIRGEWIQLTTGVSKGDFASKSHMVFNIMVLNMRGKSDKEGVLIASKLTLVIYSLSNTGIQHIPYRESKLTRVLRDCLGGNCRTCLMVTVPTQSSSVTETMSCLQFAAQALNVPSRPIHTSQIRYTPAQVPNMWSAEKNSLLLTRTQILPPVSADRRSQASLPSIVSSPGPLTQLKSKRSLEVSESRSFLPHLEKHRPSEPSRYHGCGSRITEEKSGAVDVCIVKSAIPLSRCLSGSVFAESLHRHSTEKTLSSLSSSSIPPLLPECPNCKQERKIREEYDKFIIQVKRDRDSLSQRVTELEKELKNRGGEQRDNGRVEKDKRRVDRDIGRQERANGCDETENEKKTEDEVRQISKQGDEREAGKDKIEKEVIDIRSQYRETEQKEGGKEEERQRSQEREGEKENDLTGKESFSTSHGVSEMPKNDEAELLSHIDDTKSCYERIKGRSVASAHVLASMNHPNHLSRIHPPAAVNQHYTNPTSTNNCGRREHSLLLDVMVVLYKREWFLQDAMPYVRRTLKKCGLTLDDSD